ncbi:MAG: phosphomannomutase, partial [Actinomycetota bacterium]|nr:phosphomannomutase [Actinomycetota bacterium]
MGGGLSTGPVTLELSRIFKAYDIRGVVPDELDASVARAVGSAFARFTGAPRILMGRDMRASGAELSAAFAEGATGEGADVVDLGLISTDLAYFAAGSRDAPAAMLTASHNPARYNGIKLCLPGARPVGQDTGLRDIQAMVQETLDAGAARSDAGPARSDAGQARSDAGPARSDAGQARSDAGADRPASGSVSSLDLLGEFGDHVRSFVDRGVLRPLKVVADAGNGMGGLVAPEVFRGLPFDVELMYAEL